MKSFDFFSDLTKWGAELNNETWAPWVHSVSYGTQEPSYWPSQDYMNRLDIEFQKAGLRGYSIIFASGDDGSGCAPGSNDQAKCGCIMSPSYPAISEFVTSVGATRFLTGNTGPEGAVQAFGSGGGFAPYYLPLASWQDDAVTAYLADNTSLPKACSFNKSGRATPDVSALGDIKFEVYQGGSKTLVGGTSASAPTFAAVITLLNDIRLHNNKPVLGFLNPWIYQTAASDAEAFFDVVQGNNNVPDCCSSGKGGFACAKGWDAATGVGTPNFEVLKTHV
jgi:tripeptidyl-peptidase-1